LEKQGFISYDPALDELPPRIFADAEIVVAQHGAGLANLVFCQPGTRVLELMPSDFVKRTYYSLSHAAGLDYSVLVGCSDAERIQKTRIPSPYDFTIDEAEFRNVLDFVLTPR
jgi:capsular polysaccharide biosynthesis protein